MSSDVHIAEAMLGRDAAEFLASDVGRYLIGRCEQEANEAMQALSTVSAWRRNRIRQLQNEVWRAQSVKSWLIELITAGRQAEAILGEQEHE
jgi:hypothetical protein